MINCKMCGTPNDESTQFCSACGNPVVGELSQTKRDPKPKKAKPAQTMMFGVSPVTDTGKNTAERPPQASSTAATVAATGASKNLSHHTVKMVDTTSSPSGQPVKPKMGGNANKTMFGVPNVSLATPHATKPASVKQAPMVKMASPSPARQASSAKPVQKQVENKRTMMGIPAMAGEAVEKAIAEAQKKTEGKKAAQELDNAAQKALVAQGAISKAAQEPKVAAVPDELRSAEPVVAPKPVPQEIRAAQEEVPKSVSAPVRSPEKSVDAKVDDEDFDYGEEQPPQSGNKVLLAVAVFAIIVLLVGVGLLGYLLLTQNNDNFVPQVFPSPDGTQLTMSVAFAEAPAGSVLQIGNQQVPLVGGRGSLNIPVAGLSLGANTIAVQYIKPGEVPEMLSFPIMLRHSVSTDMTGLKTANPYITVNFQVAPGNKLSVGQKPVQLSNNAYSHIVHLSEIPLGKSQGQTEITHEVVFQLIDAKGVAEQGKHSVVIPVTQLQIDRPADNAVIDLPSVTCQGTTEPGATVVVNGQQLGVTASGFNGVIPLEAVGEHTIKIVARAPGKAPRTEIRKVMKVQSLTDSIKEWSKDIDKKLDYPTLALNPNWHAGKKVSFSGRIVKMSIARGVTAFLMYMGGGCPERAKCAVYVAFKGETNAGPQSMVDIYGTVRGSRDVELIGGGKETMPALDATFVVKSVPQKGKRRK